MKTIEINKLPGQVALNLGRYAPAASGLAVSRHCPKSPYVRPKVLVDARAVAAYAKVWLQAGAWRALAVPHMLAFPLSMMLFGSKYYPWPAMGTVHLANQARQLHRIDVGDELRIEMQTGELLAHERGRSSPCIRVPFDATRWCGKAPGTFSAWGVGRIGFAFRERVDRSGTAVASGRLLRRRGHWPSVRAGLGRREPHPLVSAHGPNPRVQTCHRARHVDHGRALSTLMPREPAEQASVTAEFKTPLYLPARTSLWTNRTDASTLFEVRNAKGDKPHLRGRVTY